MIDSRILLLCASLKHFDDWVQIKVNSGGEIVQKYRDKVRFKEDGKIVEYFCFTFLMNADKLSGGRFDFIQPEIYVSEREMMFFNMFVR